MDAPKKIRVRETRLYSRPALLRMPFHFGNAKIEKLDCALLKVIVEDENGKNIPGIGATIFSPMWFEKNPDISFEERQQSLEDSIAQAANLYQEHESASAWDLHRELEIETRRLNSSGRFNDLTAGFGCALMDSAIIDAICRATDQGLHGVISTNALGLGEKFSELLDKTPKQKIDVRHTVGLVDPLYDNEIIEPINDGLPESLEAVIESYGIRWFKLKASANEEEVMNRLCEVNGVLTSKLGKGNFHVTIDANEQFQTPKDFLSFLDVFESTREIGDFRKQILWVEQPLHRNTALNDEFADELAEINRRIPVIIDESNGTDEAFESAIQLGYRGVSAKNCKGPFRTFKNFEIIERNNRTNPEKPLFLSSEDLTNVPILPLHQDLCVAGTLGIRHTERNGHHYVNGLQFLDPVERQWAMEKHPEVYTTGNSGLPIVNIRHGQLDISRVLETGYGGDFMPNWDTLNEIKLN